MGIVLKESYRNTLTLIIAIGIGAINTLFLYVYYLDTAYYGLISFLLSTSLILKPLVALGANYGIIKFFSSYTNKQEKDRFLTLMLLLPLLALVPLGIIGGLAYEQIRVWFFGKSDLTQNYGHLIYWVTIFITYFDVFYAWTRVHLKSVVGNLFKELFVRVVIFILLFLVGFDLITETQFVYAVVGAYGLQMFCMGVFAFRCYCPNFTFALPSNTKEIIQYCCYIILAGSAASILLDIDKFMIPQHEAAIEQVAYYAVAVYMGTIIEIPGRAMSQIVQPLTAQAINEKNDSLVLSLYQKTSINLLIAAGAIFILVLANLDALYLLLPKKYTGGFWIVLMIATAKLYHMLLGNNGAIISNSAHYKILLPYGIAMAITVIVLNHVFIQEYSIHGAALSTLFVVLIFNTLKLWYVQKKMSLLPFTVSTLWALLLIVLLAALGIFIKTTNSPFVSIALESFLLMSLYIGFVLVFRLSEDLNNLWIQFWKKLK
ncbi:lipopolysaccharide biosynthesis protein [Ochrovirga pacifica]|uniref:lipopolysaccharide biosynthesis protein n=1 Tax=Ochrovirga pacifica TaxID=1042376 RepID=UPI000255A4D1|nr:oligosaccharide flippase family protein [Ochrovirga pacifica]